MESKPSTPSLQSVSGVQSRPKIGLVFRDMLNVGAGRYPCWRHHKALKSILVYNTEDDEKAREQGYEEPHVPITANHSVSNWFWDLEDMSPRQLRVYAVEEYDVDLPEEASQETLFRAVLDLGKHAPQNRNRLVLMAHTIKMNYDETLEEIRRMMTGPPGTVSETETYEVII